MPASRLPFLAVSLVLTLTLAAVGLVQLRQAAELARRQQAFVAGTSHELRTPLAQIRLFAETLRLGRTRSEAEREHALTVVERETRRLEHLVENLLHVARPGRARPPLAASPHDLAQLTASIVGDLIPLADKAGVTMAIDRLDRSPVAVDSGAWRQITTNLIDNAIKYAGSGTRISVSVEAGTGFHQVVVADEGPGVSASDRARVWERFWRGEDRHTRGTTGTGIGLATVRDLVQMHAGECAVEPNQPRGARFVIRIPAAP
jgi:two-component system phosphate regulon sensor histidine kinase PhoR